MRNIQTGLLASVIAGLVAGQLAIAQKAPDKPAAPTTTASADNEAIFREIETTLGFVPRFFRDVPDTLLPSFWNTMKTFEMNPNTALDAKTKELIGLAVSSQIPCDYCVYFHTEAAKAAGATDQQIREAVGMAGVIRMGSTIVNGTQTDLAQFKKDVNRLMRKEGKPKKTATR